MEWNTNVSFLRAWGFEGVQGAALAGPGIKSRPPTIFLQFNIIVIPPPPTQVTGWLDIHVFYLFCFKVILNNSSLM